MEAVKHDQGKLKLSLIPPEAEIGLGEVLTMGSTKYGPRNWELGLDADRLISALRRHLNAWQRGELLDAESGLSHLKHVLCNAAFMVTLEERGKLVPPGLPAVKQPEWDGYIDGVGFDVRQ